MSCRENDEYIEQRMMSVAMGAGDERWLKILLENGIDPGSNKEIWREFLELCECRHGSFDWIGRPLIEAGANVNQTGTYSRTALFLACLRDDYKLVEMLLEKGADPNISDVYKKTPIQVAHSKPILLALMGAGADVNQQDNFGRTPLFQACSGHSFEKVCALLEVGADVNSQDENGFTSLMQATRQCRKDMVQLLLEKGADPNMKNNKGSTAYRFAASQKHGKEILELFKALRLNEKMTNRFLKTVKVEKVQVKRKM